MKNDPFASLGALDQKLFRPRGSSVPSRPSSQRPSDRPQQGQETKEPWNQASKEASKDPGLEPTNLGPSSPAGMTVKHEPAALSLNQRPDRQNTYAFTTRELERLEDVKIAITRHYDLGVTKNDLVRCAVHILLEEYEALGERSSLLKRLRAKKAR